MLAFFVFLLTVGAIAYRVLTPEQRLNALRTILVTVKQIKDYRRRELEPFRRALRERTSWIVVTPALIVLNVTISFGGMLAKPSASDSTALIGWANFGPLTSNGEWWRLVSALFVQQGLLALVLTVVVLAQLGSILERLVGRATFASVYLTAGVFANLVTLSTHPTAVSAGASGAVYGIIGQFLLWFVVGRVRQFRGRLRQSDIVIPVAALKRCVPAIAAFIAYSMIDQSLPMSSQIAGLTTGLLLTSVMTSGFADRMPSARYLAIADGASLVIVVALAIFSRGITDVNQEIQRLLAVEHRTSGTYQAAFERLSKGKLGREQLADLIDRTIVPELQQTDLHFSGLQGVPTEDNVRVAEAREYLHLRSESWRLRAAALRLSNQPVVAASTSAKGSDVSFRDQAEQHHRSTLQTFGKAEGAERASLEALKRSQQ